MAASARRNWPARFRIDDRKLGGRAETCRESRKTSCDLPVIQDHRKGRGRTASQLWPTTQPSGPEDCRTGQGRITAMRASREPRQERSVPNSKCSNLNTSYTFLN